MEKETKCQSYDFRANNAQAMGHTGMFADLWYENKRRAIIAFDNDPDAVVTPSGKTAREVLQSIIDEEEANYPKPIVSPNYSDELRRLFGIDYHGFYDFRADNTQAMSFTGLLADMWNVNKRRAIKAFDNNPETIVESIGKTAREVLTNTISDEIRYFYVSEDDHRIVHEDEKFVGFEFEIPTHDSKETGFTISGFLKRTKRLQDVSPWTIFYAHGGPHSSFTSRSAEDNWESDMDDMIKLSGALGVQVVGFDFRGSIMSASYAVDPLYKSKESTWKHVGKNYQNSPELTQNFADSVNGDFGGGHMQDLLSVYNYITNTYKEYVDPKKIIIAGHSFGGYTAALAVMHPQLKNLFAASVIMSGFYDNLTQFSHVTKGDIREMRQSPINFVSEINVPIIIFHGLHDENTLTTYIGAENFVRALNGSGKNVLFQSLDEAHDYKKPESIATIIIALSALIESLSV
jgi:pimeloyl-ACP methyl ester carboxylesterase